MRVVYKKYNLAESGGGLGYYEIKESKKYGTYNSSFGKYGSYTFDRNSGTFTLMERNGHYSDSAVYYSFLQSDSGSSNTRAIHIFYVSNGEIRYYSTLYSEKVAASYSQGSYIGEVEAEDGYYPRNGRQNGYWYVWDRYANTAPTISGSYTDIGVVKKDFDITYTVKDADNDDVKVEIRVDNNVIQYPMNVPLNRTQTVRIKIDEYGLGQHTITITATDSSNSSATRTYYFTKSNTAPTISGSNVNMGALYKDFDVDYIVQDADGDDVKVSILVDGYIKQSATPTSLGIRKYFHVDMNQYSLGRHRIEIIAEDGFGAKSTRTITFEKVNSAPIISGRDENLGAKNTSFSYTYSVSDNEKDSVRVVERLNGNTIRTLTNASLNTEFSIDITSEQIKKLDINKVNTIEIEASDGNATTFRRVTFTRNNMPPIISGKDVDLGEKDKSLSYSYSATDSERDKIFATVYLDDKVLIARKSIVDGASQNIKIDGLEFLKIAKGNHRIEIVVEDDKGFKSTRTVRFTRTIARLVMELGNKGIDTGSTLAKRVLVSTVGIYVAKGAIAKYEVCNNSFDSNPTWENATTMVNAGKAFSFQNKSKTAAKAGINIRVSIDKGESKMASYISSIGGSFD